jgi:hypothetical protein
MKGAALRKVLGLSCLAGVGLLMAAQQPARADDDDDGVDTGTMLAAQQCDEWCWAATVEMVTTELGQGVPQCKVVSLRYGPQVNCCAPAACYTACNQGSGGPTILRQALQYWGIHGNEDYRPLQEPELRAALKTGEPVIAASQPHAFVISGYAKDRGMVRYHVLDPFFGESYETYQQLLIHGGSPWVFTWHHFHT